MFAVIKTGGKQYRVNPDDVVSVEKLAGSVGDTVVFGARVKVKDLDYDDEEVFELVGPGDEDYDKNKILTTSPIGQGLLGKRVGETAEIQVPKGTIRFQILGIN